MNVPENSMDKPLNDAIRSSASTIESIEQLEAQIQDTEKFLISGGEKSLNIIDILQRSRQDFFAIFDSVPAVIWYRDRDGKILRANQCAADSVGIGVRELMGQNYYDLVSDDAERSRREDIEVIVSGRPRQGVLREYALADGMNRWMMEDRFPLRDKAGKVIGVMVFAQDVTQNKLAEERLVCAKHEIEIRNEQLRLAAEQSHKFAEQASRSNLAKSQLLASSSHDLRTPMNAVIGFAELLLDTPLNDEQTEYVQTICKSSKSLLSLINDILDFTKLEVGKLSVQLASCNLSTFIEDIRSMMEPGICQKGLTFTLQLDPRLPETIYTDPFRLRQCLVNLIGNAMKFTENGGVSLFIKPDRRAGRSCIRFDVEDTGIGISRDKQLQIFKSYEQGEDVIERVYGGTGLGLAITRRLMGLLGGDISLISEPGKGSIFSILLPLTDSTSSKDSQPSKSSLTDDAERPQSFCQGRILVADVNPAGQLSMNLLLRREGLEVEAACSPQETLEKFKASEFDVIILAFTDDNEQNLQMIRTLRASDKDIPLIAIAPSDLDLMKKALLAGCSKYLTRPVSRKELYESVFELMRQTEFEKKLKAVTPPRDAEDQPGGKSTPPQD